MTKKAYTRRDKEFKQEALKLIKSSNRPVSAIGREIGVHFNTLYSWLRKDKEANTIREGSPLNLCEKAEIKQLKKELHDAKMERDILKKAVAVFSKHQR